MSEPRTNLEIWRDALELLQEREFYDGYNHDRAQSYVSCETCGAVKYHRTSDEEHNPAHNPGCHLASTLRELAEFDAAEERLEEERERSAAGVLPGGER